MSLSRLLRCSLFSGSFLSSFGVLSLSINLDSSPFSVTSTIQMIIKITRSIPATRGPNAFANRPPMIHPKNPPPDLPLYEIRYALAGDGTAFPYMITSMIPSRNITKKKAAHSLILAMVFPLFDTAKKIPISSPIGST